MATDLLEALGISASSSLPRRLLVVHDTDGNELSIDERSLAAVFRDVQFNIFKVANYLSTFIITMGATSKRTAAGGSGQLFVDTTTKKVYYDAPAKVGPYSWVEIDYLPGSTEHGDLVGLADDDHPQYAKDRSEVPLEEVLSTGTGTAYTAVIGTMNRYAPSTVCTVTLPTSVGVEGQDLLIARVAGGDVTIEAYGAETIGGGTSLELLAVGDCVQLTAGNTGWYVSGFWTDGLNTVISDLSGHEVLVNPHGTGLNDLATLVLGNLIYLRGGNVADTLSISIAGIDGSDNVSIGDSGQSLKLHGADTRPDYNGNDLALHSDATDVASDLSDHEALLPSEAHPWNVNTNVAAFTAEMGALELCNSAGGSFAANLPAISASNSGRETIIKKVVAGNTVTLTPNGSDTIDGASSIAMTTKDSFYRLMSDGATRWRVIGKG